MKRKILSLAAALFASATVSAQSVTISIKGTTADTIKQVRLFVNTNRKDATSINVTNGTFTYTAQAATNDIIIIEEGDFELAFVADATPVSLDFNSMTIDGSAVNNEFGKFQTAKHAYDLQLQALYLDYKQKSRLGEAAKAEIGAIIQRYDSIESIVMDMAMDYIPKHKSDVSPAYLIHAYSNGFDYATLEKILVSDAAYYNHVMTGKAKENLKRLSLRRPGRMFADLEMSDPAGQPHKLSEWVGRGNYVLVDFWASWCGPCRQEMPNVVEAYRRYHDRGFDVVAVSFDQDATSWKNGIEKLGMVWHNISDLKGWRCAASEKYGVNSIPSNVLVDPQGKIIASDLRGNALLLKLSEIYNK